MDPPRARAKRGCLDEVTAPHVTNSWLPPQFVALLLNSTCLLAFLPHYRAHSAMVAPLKLLCTGQSMFHRLFSELLNYLRFVLVFRSVVSSGPLPGHLVSLRRAFRPTTRPCLRYPVLLCHPLRPPACGAPRKICCSLRPPDPCRLPRDVRCPLRLSTRCGPLRNIGWSFRPSAFFRPSGYIEIPFRPARSRLLRNIGCSLRPSALRPPDILRLSQGPLPFSGLTHHWLPAVSTATGLVLLRRLPVTVLKQSLVDNLCGCVTCVRPSLLHS
mmetsp:Transcript_43794/g.115681  ORF Transcript_43794/g.115681 Transcript_43794/m.115681 type:complete len:271 (+) Transcript_43794:432-1244(+)